MDFKERPKYSSIKYLFHAGTGSKFSPKTTKFKYILNDFDLDKPCNEMIEKLIEKGYYVIDEEQREYIPDFVPEEYELGCEVNYKNTPYSSSADFYDEVYHVLKGIVDYLYHINFTKDISSITLKIKSHLSNSEKIDFLKNFLKECYAVDNEDAEEFSIFLEGQESWKYEIESCMPFESEIFHYYLKKTEEEKLTNSIILNKHVPQWIEFYRRSELIDFCRKKIKELETPIETEIKTLTNTEKVKSNLSVLIFSEGGEEIFNHLILNSPNTKNKAFFNYLYYFMRDEIKKIKIMEDDSKFYKNYVIELGYIESNWRMKNVQSGSKKTHNQMMELFKEIYIKNFE